MRSHPSARFYRYVSTFLVVLGLSGVSQGQTLYGFDGPAARAIEFTGPPAGFCGYPGGPMVSGFVTPVPFLCPTAGSPPAATLGDIAVDKRNDTVWVTDGMNITEYTPAGAVIRSFLNPTFAPGPITGLGFDSITQILWATDGGMAYALNPPAIPGCGGLATFAVPPFPLPALAPATDIEWDSLTGSLWLCNTAGMVMNVLPGGGAGPFGTFSGTALCGFGPGLTGIAVDNAAGALGTIYVTDGFRIGYLDAATGGGPAPLTFYTTANCYMAPGPGPLVGLAFSAHAIRYGVSSDNSGLVGPTIGSVGHTTSPNPGFTVTLSGSVPGGTAALFYGQAGALCPPIPVSGVLLLVVPPIFAVAGSVPVGAIGTATQPTPIPPAIIGLSFWLQWVVITPVPSLQLSDGLELTGSAF